MENEKINQLKEKLKDKSLTNAQRQKIMQEIADESYKTDTRKPMSLYQYRRLQFIGFSLFCIEQIFDMITTACGIEDNTIVNIITILICIPALIFIILWFVALITRKIDREDEMAKENLNKARQGISGIVMVTLLLIMLAMTIFDSLSFTIDSGNIGDIAMLILWGYFALESGLFLIHEGRSCSDESESEEE